MVFKDSSPFLDYILTLDGVTDNSPFSLPSGSVISREGQFCFPSRSVTCREGRFCFSSGSACSFHPTQSGRSSRRGCSHSSTTISPHDVMTIILILPNLFAFFFACVEEKAYLCKANCSLLLRCTS